MLSDRRRGTRQPRLGRRLRCTRESPRPAARAPDTRGGSLRMNMTGTGTIGTRQQVERWIEESQYLLGRVIPSVFDDNQRLRERDRKSTRLNSSHSQISYAVFCLKKKKKKDKQ